MKERHRHDMPPIGVWPLGSRTVATLKRWAGEHGHRFVEVRARRNAERRDLLVAIGQAFAFPSWFGANLDALYDSLTDLPEQGGAGCVVAIAGLSSRDARDRAQPVLDVFAEAAQELAKQRYELRVFVATAVSDKDG